MADSERPTPCPCCGRTWPTIEAKREGTTPYRTVTFEWGETQEWAHCQCGSTIAVRVINASEEDLAQDIAAS